MTVLLPPCGLYRTKREVANVPAQRLVYFHNHGDPGPGIYLPDHWQGNRAIFMETGSTLEDVEDTKWLEPLSPEGFYRVVRAFHCCDQQCHLFDEERLVQLGYDGEATPILFTPEIIAGQLALPDEGIAIDDERFAHLAPLKIDVVDEEIDEDMLN